MGDEGGGLGGEKGLNKEIIRIEQRGSSKKQQLGGAMSLQCKDCLTDYFVTTSVGLL